jgi:hypothetical protein
VRRDIRTLESNMATFPIGDRRPVARDIHLASRRATPGEFPAAQSVGSA